MKNCGFIRYMLLLLFAGISCFVRGQERIHAENKTLRIAVFDVDATPPVGSDLTYQRMKNSWDLGLRAKGMVLTGAGQPIVLCAIDWIGIANESQDVFKQALAEAAGTIPERVAVHTLHQHDAPICDFTAEKILKAHNMPPGCFDGTFARRVIKEIQQAIRTAANGTQPVTHIGLGKAEVYRVASNRRILDTDGKVRSSRPSSCRDSLLRAMPEGVIDPEVSLVSFWNEEKPLAVLSFYATHPQSYYLTQIANPDFPGIARFMRQLAVPDALHIHFNGAGGNIATGKYNDGSHENRRILAERLADGMKRAWENTRKTNVTCDMINWDVRSIALPPADGLEEIEKKIQGQEKENPFYLANYLGHLGWLKRRQEGKKNEIECLTLGEAKILFTPGELFVEYQLAAKATRPDLFVAMAAYGDYGTLYIGTEESYSQDGYEPGASATTEKAGAIIMGAIRELLSDEKENDHSSLRQPPIKWVQESSTAGWKARDSQGEVVYKGSMWILGGWHDSYQAPPRDVWRSKDGKRWEKMLDNAPWLHSDLPMSVVFKNRMWMMGGWYNGRLEGRSASNGVWSSQNGKEWKLITKNAGWTPRCAAAIVVFKNKIWILGGTTAYYYGGKKSLLNDVWYSGDGKDWKQATADAGWAPRAYHQAVVLNDRIYIMGGGNYDPEYWGYNDVWSSADGIHWRQETSRAEWHERLWFSSVVYRNCMWVVGGWSGNPSKNWDDIWYSTDGKHWTELKSEGVKWKERHEHSAFVFQDKIWIAGGMSPPLLNDVWSLKLPKNWVK